MSWLDPVVRWSLHRPRLVALIALWAFVCAVHALGGVKLAFLPSLAPAEAMVVTQAPGLVAEQVEQTVTRPVESDLIGTLGVDQVRSQSIQGLSVITARFAAGADPLRVRQLLAANLARAGALPDGVSAPRLEPLTSPDAGVLELGFTSDTLDPMALRDIVEWTVRPRLLSVPGVGRVTLHGGRQRRIEVHARPGDLSDSDLGFLDIVQATRRATSVTGAGFIDTPNQRVLIEPHGQALTADQVALGQIQTPGADPVRIADVADVVEAAAPSFGDALINGRPGVLLTIDAQLGADRLATSDAVDQALTVLGPALKAQGVQVSADLDRPARFVRAAFNGVLTDLLIGLACAAAVLLLIIRDPRAVLVALVSVPLTLVAATVALGALGMSLNIMTLGGLAVALGMVLDDAVIDVENILATLRDAEARHESRLLAVHAASLEMRGPVVKAALPVIAALAPLLLLKGPEGALLAPLATAIIVGVLASLMVTLTVTPALSLLFLRHIKPGTESRIWRRVVDWQAARLSGLASHRWVAALILAMVVLVVGLGAALLRPQLLPTVEDRQLVVEVDAPAGASPSAVVDLGVRLSHELAATPGVASVDERIGRDANGDDATPIEHGQFDLGLQAGLGSAAQRAVARDLARRLSLYPGLSPQIRSGFDNQQSSEGAAAPLGINVYGADLDGLDQVAGQVLEVISGMPGAGTVTSPGGERTPVLRADVDFSRLALFGLSAADVLDTVQAAFAGEVVGKIYDGSREVDLAVSAQDQLRQDPEAVGDLLLRSTSGISEPLKSIANVYLTDGRAQIAHENGLRVRRIEVSPTTPDTRRFEAAARAAIDRQVHPPAGVFVEFTRPDAGAAARRDLAINYALAAAAIFALVAVAFDARSAALILGAPLFAFVGGVIAVALMGGALSVGAMAGFIALLGLSIRGAILLIAQVEERVLSHQAAWSMESVIAAARDRASPIVITALLVATTLAPMALRADQSGRELLGPMAWVIIGGLITGTSAELLIMPVLTFAFWRPGYARWAKRSHRSHPAVS